MAQNLDKKLAEVLRTIYRGLDLYHDELLQLSPKELTFLLVIEDMGGCRVKDLAARVNLPLSTVSWTADKMVKKKFISRKTDSVDRRAIILSLATQGKKAIRKHEEIFDGIAAAAVQNLTPAEMQSAIMLIEKVAEMFR